MFRKHTICSLLSNTKIYISSFYNLVVPLFCFSIMLVAIDCSSIVMYLYQELDTMKRYISMDIIETIRMGDRCVDTEINFDERND